MNTTVVRDMLEALLASLPQCNTRGCREPATRIGRAYRIQQILCDLHPLATRGTMVDVIYEVHKNAATVREARELLVRLATEPNVDNLLIHLGRSIVDWQDATESLRHYNEVSGRNEGSFSVYAEAAREFVLPFLGLELDTAPVPPRGVHVARQLQALARAKAVALYNEQNPYSPRT
jgi:hypothetical protein